MPTTLVFYDGVCGLCDGFVRFLLKRDRDARFKFAALQGELARAVLPTHGIDPAELSSVVIVTAWQSADQRVFTRSRAVLEAERDVIAHALVERLICSDRIPVDVEKPLFGAFVSCFVNGCEDCLAILGRDVAEFVGLVL